jgi:L-threonylcarbamoyladenylate synthase
MPETFCANLFSKLREFSGKADLIFTEALPVQELGLAYMNRLLRAAGFQTL